MADQIGQAFAVLPEASAEAFAPAGIGIKAFDVFIVKLIQPFAR